MNDIELLKKCICVLNQVVHVGDCWVWTGAKNNKGYGSVWVNGKKEGVHRLVYSQLAGPIPDGLHIDHICCTRECINPRHLEPVTATENNRRMWARRRSSIAAEL